MIRITVLALLLLVGCGPTPPTRLYDWPLVPAAFTTGSLCTLDDPDFDELRYPERVVHCRRNVSENTKRDIYASYGMEYNPGKAYTIDHLIPLSLGGTNHNDNLWPQHKSLYTGQQEYFAFCLVRDGLMPVRDAVNHVLDLKFQRTTIRLPRPANCEDYK